MKEAVLPFHRFPDADTVLGPEMRSTGEVMGIDLTVGLAFAKSQIAAGDRLPESGTVFLSLADRDKPTGAQAARVFHELGFAIAATVGTAAYLEEQGTEVATVVAKLGEEGGGRRRRPHRVRQGRPGGEQPRGRGPRADGDHIRRGGEGQHPGRHDHGRRPRRRSGMADWSRHELRVRTLQEYHQGVTHDQLTLTRRSVTSHPHLTGPVPKGGVDLSTTVGSVTFPNPVMTASGTAGHGTEPGPLRGPRVARRGRREVPGGWPRAGNSATLVHEAAGMVNSIGLQGPGVPAWLDDDLPALQPWCRGWWSASGGRTVEEYGEGARSWPTPLRRWSPSR